MPKMARVQNLRTMTLLAQTRRRIQQLGPYQSLALLLVPTALVEPLKVVALFVAGKGHWLTGTGMIVGAYSVSLLIVHRLFKAVRPKMMMLSWFDKLWTRFSEIRDRVRTWPTLLKIRTEYQRRIGL
jgi:hypothetical protein